MADTEVTAPADEVPGEKETNKSPSPKPDRDVAPPLISVSKGEAEKTYYYMGSNHEINGLNNYE